MKKLLTICLLTLATLTAQTSVADEERLDNIVAIVNDDVVTSSEFNHALTIARMQMEQQSASLSGKKLRKHVLTQLINKKLQLQIAKQNNINTDDAELDKAIAHIAEQNSMSTGELYQRLQQDGMSKKDYRSELREQLVLHKLQQQELIGRINVTPQEIKSYKQNHAWQDASEKEYHLEDILIPLADNSTADRIAIVKQQAQEVYDHLQQGKSLASIAKKYAKTKHAIQNEDFGWRKLSEIPSAFSDKVSRMQNHSLAGPIQTGNGFHLLRLIDSRAIGGQQAKLSDKQVETLLLQRKYEQAIENWLLKLRSQAFIKVNDDKEHV